MIERIKKASIWRIIKMKAASLWWHIKRNGFIEISLDYQSPFKTVREIKKGFIAPKLVFARGIVDSEEFGYYQPHACILDFETRDAEWKDKWRTPRFEGERFSVYGPSPRVQLFLFRRWIFLWYWTVPDVELPEGEKLDEALYYEMAIWWMYYKDKDMKKARSSWGWTDMDNNTTWRDYYVRPDLRE